MALVGFRGQSKLSTWFYRLAVNEVNRALKDRIVHRERFEPLVTREPDGEERELAIEAKPDNHNARIDLEQLCRRLSPDQAELISLKQHGYSLEEIGQKTNEPLGTIRSRYRLAKNKLRKRHKPMNQIGEVI